MVKFWQASNIALKSSYRMCSIKNPVLKNLAILIGKHLCWSLFLINLEVYKPGILLQWDSDTSVFLWILRNFYKGLFQRTSVNDCFWTSLIQSGRYSNRKNRDVFRDDNQRRIQNSMKHLKAFCKNSWLYLTVSKHVSFISNWFTFAAEYK